MSITFTFEKGEPLILPESVARLAPWVVFTLNLWPNEAINVQNAHHPRFSRADVVAMFDNLASEWRELRARTPRAHNRAERHFAGMHSLYPAHPNPIVSAIVYDNVDALAYALSNGVPWPENGAIVACENNCVDCLRFIVEHDGPIDVFDCEINAITCGSYECFLIIRELQHDVPDSQFTRVVSEAARADQLEFMQRAVADGYPVARDVILECLEFSSFRCILYAQELGCFWPRHTAEIAAAEGLDDLVEAIHARGLPTRNRDDLHIAIENADFDGVEELIANGATMIPEHAYAAAESDSRYLLGLLHENGCPMDPVVLGDVIDHRDLGNCIGWFDRTFGNENN